MGQRVLVVMRSHSHVVALKLPKKREKEGTEGSEGLLSSSASCVFFFDALR